MRSALLTLLSLAVFPLSAPASTGGHVELTCPLDQTRFQAYQNFSGTSFGMRLDLKQTGPIAQPWALALCPTCSLPLYKDDFTPEEKEKLKGIVASDAFKARTQDKPSYYTLAVLLEDLHEAPFDIAWAYLQASWQVENKKEELYKATLQKTLEWCGKVGADAQPPENHHLALYLTVELHRKRGEFDLASAALLKAEKIKDSPIEWLPEALKLEKQLIADKNSANQELGGKKKADQ